MRQELNLYTTDLRPTLRVLNSLNMLAVCAGLLFFLILWQLFTWYQTQQLHSQAQGMLEQQRLLSDQASQLRAEQPKSQAAQLITQIETLAAELERRENIKETIAGQNLGNSDGFSQQMQSLARQRVSGLSLTGFKLLDSGHILELDGAANRSAAVPLYIQRLKQEPEFTGVRFGTLVIEQPESDGLALEFSLQKVVAANDE